MKKLALLICLAFVAPAFVGGCAAPSARVQEVKTLKAVGVGVDATMKIAAQMFHDGKISAQTWAQIAEIHDAKFIPAYNLAVKAVAANLDSLASPDLIALASQLTAVLAPYISR